MSPSTPPRNNQFAVNLPKAMWLASTKIDFIELSKTAAKWPRVSETYCFAGVDQEKHHKITNGRSDELDKALHDIYAEHGPVTLQVGGRDPGGRYFLKCSQPGNKHSPAKAIICVSPTQAKKYTKAAAQAEPSPLVSDGKMQNLDDWEEVVIGEKLEAEDDWVKV